MLLIADFTTADILRFWSKVEIGDGCWRWLGGLDRDGYGRFWDGRTGKTVKASRIAYEMVKGPLGNDIGRHTCDNPPCCRPSHVVSGGHASNARDRVERGRGATLLTHGDWVPSEHRPRGELHPNSILTEAKVIEIRQLDLQGLTMTEIGRRVGIGRNAVRKILTGQTWRHVVLMERAGAERLPGW